jgi:hypothetical protein
MMPGNGNVARGEQTGLHVTPDFNGYYFAIGEVGGRHLPQTHRELHPEPETEPQLLAGHRHHLVGHHPVLTICGMAGEVAPMI